MAYLIFSHKINNIQFLFNRFVLLKYFFLHNISIITNIIESERRTICNNYNGIIFMYIYILFLFERFYIL